MLRRLRDERNPADVPGLVNKHDVLAVASLCDAPDDVVFGPQLVFQTMLNVVGLILIQFLADELLHFIANRLAQLGFIETLNFDPLHCVTGIDIRLGAGFSIALL